MEALQWANETLKRHVDSVAGGSRLDSPMLDAEVLLSAAMDANKAWLFTHLDTPLKREQEDRFREFLKRRTAHEPVAYIIGHREFFKRRFWVNRFVLIPRPATETLVELALAAVRTPEAVEPDACFADIGTGSGAIAVTLAAESRLPVIASDMSRQALAVAAKNADEHGVADLVDFRHGNLLEPLVKIFASVGATHPSAIHHLVICANLPYLSDAQWKTAQREVHDFEPHEALASGRDGLDDYWELFRQLKRDRGALPERVTVLIEIDPSQRQTARDLIAHDFPHARAEATNDLEGFARVITVEL